MPNKTKLGTQSIAVNGLILTIDLPIDDSKRKLGTGKSILANRRKLPVETAIDV